MVPVAAPDELRHDRVVASFQRRELATPAHDLRVRGVATPARSDDGTHGVSFGVLTEQVCTAQDGRVHIPDAHGPSVA